jgi:hypothetical protein
MYLCSPFGALAERLGTGLQNLGQRFDSARHLEKRAAISGRPKSIYYPIISLLEQLFRLCF